MDHLPAFERVASLGFYRWLPSEELTAKGAKPFASVVIEDVLLGLTSPEDGGARENQPDRLLKDIPTPQPLKELPQQLFVNKFPHNPGYVVPLFVAAKRGLVIEDIDFVLGGSTLEVLAHKFIDRGGDSDGARTRYLCQRVATSKGGVGPMVVCKHKEYVENRMDHGHQFERMAVGRKPEEKDDGSMHEGLTHALVGGFNVLFCAEADAVVEGSDGKLQAVECKSGNPRYFGTKVMWQMVSSDSQLLVQGQKQRRGPGQVLSEVKMRPISEVIADHPPASIAQMRASILDCLSLLKHAPEISAGHAMELDFAGGALTLAPVPEGVDILPREDVVVSLMELAKQ